MVANFSKKLVLLFVSMFVAIATAQAQMDPQLPNNSTEIPIDGGVLGLLVAGAIYGAKKVYDHKKKK